jgi:hypothetical protein
MRDTKTQDFVPKFGHPQWMPTSPLWSSKRSRCLSTLIRSERSQDLVQFPLSNPHKGEGNTNFSGSTTILVTPDNLVCLVEQIPKSNEHMEIVGEVLEMKIEWVTKE